MMYINDSESLLKNKNDHGNRYGANEKFWARKVGEHKLIVDTQPKPLSAYVDEDIIKVLGLDPRKVTSEVKSLKTRHN
jgi:hypothetical protein